MVGIVSYGTYVPRCRIKISDIANVWKKNGTELTKSLRVEEKAVPSIDEDAVTLAVEASYEAIGNARIAPERIGSIFIGSESHPYAVNPSATIVGDALGVGSNYFAADLEFACKAATAGLQITLGLIADRKISYGLVVGSDTAQAKPQDVLEYTAAAGACALVIGDKKSEVVAQVLMTSSVSSNTPDFWRRDGQRYPSHFGRFTGEPAYFSHVLSEAKKLLTSSKLKPSDFSYCVFHMPNGKFPRVVAKTLGFTSQQLLPSLIVEKIGNPYSASSLLGLASVLDLATANQKIFFVSYGSGAGSDGFIFETTQNITKMKRKHLLQENLNQKSYIPYTEYLKKTHKI